MKSMHSVNSGQALVMREVDVPQPKPQRGEVLIRVNAAGITPTELSWYPSSHKKNGGKRLQAVPSHEFSGEIVEIGEGVEEISVGQEIYGMNDWFEDGALAEYCITQPAWIAPKPQSLTYAEAASVPIGALTAWQGLFQHAELEAGERVLVHGGAGAVGVYVIQMARSRGAYVITTVSSQHLEFARELGAQEVLDYKAAPFEETVRNVDVVFDAVGGSTLERSWGVLKRSGRLVTIAANSEATSDERIQRSFFIVEPNHDQLVEIGKLLDSGALHAIVDTVLPFQQAAEAYAGTLARKGRGKLVVTIPA